MAPPSFEELVPAEDSAPAASGDAGGGGGAPAAALARSGQARARPPARAQPAGAGALEGHPRGADPDAALRRTPGEVPRRAGCDWSSNTCSSRIVPMAMTRDIHPRSWRHWPSGSTGSAAADGPPGTVARARGPAPRRVAPRQCGGDRRRGGHLAGARAGPPDRPSPAPGSGRSACRRSGCSPRRARCGRGAPLLVAHRRSSGPRSSPR